MCLKQWLFENSVEKEVGLTEIHNSFESLSQLPPASVTKPRQNMVRCSVCCECCWILRWHQENTDTLRSNCSSGDLVQLGEKCIPGYWYWFSEVYFFGLKGIKTTAVVWTGRHTSRFFCSVLGGLQEITTGKVPSCDNPITIRVCLLLPSALHSDVSVLTCSSPPSHSAGPGAGSSRAGPAALAALRAPRQHQTAPRMMMGKAAAGDGRIFPQSRDLLSSMCYSVFPFVIITEWVLPYKKERHSPADIEHSGRGPQTSAGKRPYFNGFCLLTKTSKWIIFSLCIIVSVIWKHLFLSPTE